MSAPKKPKVDWDNWDGQKYEEDKSMYAGLKTPKSRWRWEVGACFKKCKNRDIKCHECYAIAGKYTEFEPED